MCVCVCVCSCVCAPVLSITCHGSAREQFDPTPISQESEAKESGANDIRDRRELQVAREFQTVVQFSRSALSQDEPQPRHITVQARSVMRSIVVENPAKAAQQGCVTECEQKISYRT